MAVQKDMEESSGIGSKSGSTGEKTATFDSTYSRSKLLEVEESHNKRTGS